MSVIFLRFAHDRKSKEILGSSYYRKTNSCFCNEPFRQLCLLYGLPVSLLSKMQSIQNSVARIVSRKRLHDHISPILNELHWLPVEKRITFKLLILAFKCNQGVAPQYLLDIVKSYQPARNLRSSSINLLTPYSAITKGYGQRAFQYAIPKLWNSLPNHLRECQSFEQFKTKLKTYLFSSN